MEPYESGKILMTDLRRVYHAKSVIKGIVVAVLNHKLDNRQLKLIKTPSRAVKRSEIHELIGTNETAFPGSEVNKVWYVGFFEVINGGIIIYGDNVYVNNRKIGTVIGFDETHMPNHINIIVKLEESKTGAELGIRVGDEIEIK